MASAFVEFRLEFNPVQSQSVKEALHYIHAHHDTSSYAREYSETDPELVKMK